MSHSWITDEADSTSIDVFLRSRASQLVGLKIEEENRYPTKTMILFVYMFSCVPGGKVVPEGVRWILIEILCDPSSSHKIIYLIILTQLK